MIRKRGEKYYFVIENYFELFLLKILLQKKGVIFFKKKIELTSRIRKEEKKETKENLWLSLQVEEVKIENSEIITQGRILNSWIKKSIFRFTINSELQAIPKKSPDEIFNKFITTKEKNLYVVFFFHELLKVFLIEDNRVSLWLIKEFQYDSYYVDIKKYLVPLMEKIQNFEDVVLLLYTSPLINQDLRDYLEDYSNYNILLGSEDEDLYTILRNKKNKVPVSTLRDSASIKELENFIINKYDYSSEPIDLYLCKKPIRIYIIPSLFSDYFEEYYHYLLMFHYCIKIIRAEEFKHSYYMPVGLLIIYHE